MGMTRRTVLWVLPVLFAWTGFWIVASGQEEGNAVDSSAQSSWRIGVLFWHDSPNDQAALKGIRDALEETGRDCALIVRCADSDPDQVQRILNAFKKEPVDLIFAMGTRAALLSKEQVKEIPVVFTAVTNPVESGVVPSWKGSGANLAGNSNWIASETLLHLFRLAVPGLTRLGILRSETSGVVSAAELRGMQEYLGRPGAPEVEIVEQVAPGPEGIEQTVERLVQSRVQAIWIPIDFTIYDNMEQVLRGVQDHGIPLVSSSLKGAEAGAVAGVVVDYAMLGKSAVAIAIEILEGRAQPGSIPIGMMKGTQVIVNLQAARRCRYELPLSLLALADAILDEPVR